MPEGWPEGGQMMPSDERTRRYTVALGRLVTELVRAIDSNPER